MANGKRIAVLGGGSGAHAMAADLTMKGHVVNMCELPDFEENIKVPLEKQAITLIDAWGQRYDVKINKVTTDFKEALEDVEYIMMPIPAIGCKSFFSAVIPHLKDGQTIVKWSAFLPSPLQRCSKTKASRRTSTLPKVIPSHRAAGS